MPGGQPRKKNKNTSGLKGNQTLPSISMFDEGSHVDRIWEPSPLADDRDLKDIFNNRSWRFMSVYRCGLTGKAAAWAVQKQRQHRQVSERAMMSIEAVLN